MVKIVQTQGSCNLPFFIFILYLSYVSTAKCSFYIGLTAANSFEAGWIGTLVVCFVALRPSQQLSSWGDDQFT